MILYSVRFSFFFFNFFRIVIWSTSLILLTLWKPSSYYGSLWVTECERRSEFTRQLESGSPPSSTLSWMLCVWQWPAHAVRTSCLHAYSSRISSSESSCRSHFNFGREVKQRQSCAAVQLCSFQLPASRTQQTCGSDPKEENWC